MIERRPFDELAGCDHGWLKARHHFSFGDHGDPAHMGWGALRIWNGLLWTMPMMSDDHRYSFCRNVRRS